jgi:hypothetical protein
MIELVRLLGTFGIGIISFKLFERYKNRKDNNKLYINIVNVNIRIHKSFKVKVHKYYIDFVALDSLSSTVS